MALTGLEVSRQSDRVPFGSSKGEFVSCLRSFPHDLSFHLQNQQGASSPLSNSDIPASLLDFCKDLCDYTGPTHVIQDNFPIARFLY